jgi:hypothetical protein
LLVSFCATQRPPHVRETALESVRAYDSTAGSTHFKSQCNSRSNKSTPLHHVHLVRRYSSPQPLATFSNNSAPDLVQHAVPPHSPVSDNQGAPAAVPPTHQAGPDALNSPNCRRHEASATLHSEKKAAWLRAGRRVAAHNAAPRNAAKYVPHDAHPVCPRRRHDNARAPERGAVKHTPRRNRASHCCCAPVV